jgi:hypothetical protein
MKTTALIVISLLAVSVEGFVAPASRVAPRSVAIHTPRHQSTSPSSLGVSISSSFEGALAPSSKPGLLSRLIRVGNHVPAFLSLAYFGLVAMTSMMPGMASVQPTLTSVLTKAVGPTNNRMFADYFPTLVTPPSFVFLVWPTIALVQFLTLVYSSLQPMNRDATLSQDRLTSLSLANLSSTWWLLSASRTLPGQLNLSSLLILPLVPMFSTYPLRKDTRSAKKLSAKNGIFQLFSGFTTIASFLALAVELQHGTRLPIKVPAEVAASVFLGLYYVMVSMKNKSAIKKGVQAVAIAGIAGKRILEAAAGGTAGVTKLFLSVSFYGTILVTIKAMNKVIKHE